MTTAQPHHNQSKSPKLDSHRLSEFIYGTVTGMVAVASVDVGHDATWIGAASIIITGSAAIWVAHAYSTLLGRCIAEGRRAEGRDLGRALRDSWPIVVAGALLAVPLLPVSMGLWSLEMALLGSGVLGVLVLALIGVLAGAVTGETWPRRIWLPVLSAGLGIAVVAVELLVRH